MDNILISVLISIFFREEPAYFQQALESLVEQELPPDEVVIVRDGPISKELSEVITRFKKRLNVVEVFREKNGGLGAALHEGLLQCSHNLVARLDADDIALSARLRIQAKAFELAPDLDVLSGFAIEMDSAGNEGRLRTLPTTHDEILNSLWANPIIHPAVMFRRDRILAVGNFDATLRRRQDYELWFRCAEAGLKFGNVAKPLIKYRFTPETHRRQSRSDMWQQGLIGFRGARRVRLELWKQLACFSPFLRSLLPMPMQHHAYRFMQKFDPRRV